MTVTELQHRKLLTGLNMFTGMEEPDNSQTLKTSRAKSLLVSGVSVR